jgi:TolB protein
MSRGLRVALVGAALIGALARWSDHSPCDLRAAAPDPGPAKIAFLRLTSGLWQVWMMNTDGSSPQQVTTSPVDKVHVAWRPGTQEILYHTNQGDSFLLDLATRAEQRILENLKVTDAAWRPDGQRLAWGLPPDDLAHGKTSLWESDLDGKDRRRLSGDAQSDALAPSWLDGERLTFRQCVMTSNMETRHDFWLLAMRQGASRVIQGDDEKLKFDQTVSRQGMLAYSSLRSGSYEIWTLPVSGGEPRQVTRMESYAGNPSWSPEGRALAFDSDKEGPLQIYRVGSEGAEPTRLTSDPSPSRKPVWGPVSATDAATSARLDVPQTGTKPTAGDAKTSRPATPSPGALAVSWISTDRLVLDATKDERVVLRYQVSAPATVTARFIDSFDRVARTFNVNVAKAGDQRIVWDGRDDSGRPVAADAYVYTITARDAQGREATYDLRPQTAGEPVWALESGYDPRTGRVAYTLPQASRVRLFVIRKDTTQPVRSLLDWAVRGPGRHEEAWDGWSEGRVFKMAETTQITPVVYGFSLPRNAVIVEGTPAGPAAPAPRSTAAPFKPASNRTVQPHALHPRARCYDPQITLSLAGAAEGNAEVVPHVTRPTPLRIDFPAMQGEGRVSPQPRLSVFVFVDGVMVERCLSGYAPYQWILDPEKLAPGEHVITALIVWRDDHLGLGHSRVRTG